MENLQNENRLTGVVTKPVSHLRINTDEVYDFIEDKSILEILEVVKEAYPFTFIGRQKFRRRIDRLSFDFWIKDVDDKIVIVNSAYAERLNKRVSEIEGKKTSEVFSDADNKLFHSITNYIKESSNSVIYETYSKDNSDELMQNVEFPICDIDDKVVAIIGFKQKAFDLSTLVSESSSENKTIDLSDIPAVVVKVSEDFLVEQFSNKFYREFGLNPNTIINQNLQIIFNIDFSLLVNKSTTSIIKISKNEYTFEYKPVSGNNSGYYFAFNRIQERESKSLSNDKTFDMIMYTSPDPMFIYQVDNLRFLKVNEAALKFYGYREDEFLGMDLTDLYVPEDIQSLVEGTSKNTIEQGYTGPWRQKKKDGTTVKVNISKAGIEFKGLRAHFNIIRDVSKHVENDKFSSHVKTILENSSDLIVITDSDGFIKSASKSVAKELGYEFKDLIDRPFLTLVTDDYRAKINTSIFHAASPAEVSFECEFKKSDGESLTANLFANPVHGDESIEEYSIIIVPNREQEVKTIIQKEYVQEPVQTPIVQSGKSGLDSEFLSHLFHELLTPVNVIIGFAQEIADSVDELDSEQKESVEIIKQNQRILLQLMDNAVQYTQLEQNKVKLNPTKVHFVELIDQIENDVAKVADNLNKTFTYGKISSSLSIETDSSLFQSLISLLVEFAMRATLNDKVYLSAYQTDPAHCVVTIKDDRNTISKELLENMKEIFIADENIIRHKYGISRFMLRYILKVNELLADSVGVINRLGNPSEYGFTFSIKFDERKIKNVVEEESIQQEKTEEGIDKTTQEKVVKEENTEKPITVQVNVNTQANSQQSVSNLPNEKVEEPITVTSEIEAERTTVVGKDIEPVEEVVVEEIPEKEEEKKVNFEELSCLYVEDQIDSQILFKVQMKGLKSIEFANSFEKALPLLQARTYDFIIMDINLQGEYNGLDALRAIQKMENYKDIPIIAVTAYVLPGDRERFITAGFTDFISKPILRDKLESVLNNIF